MFAHLVFLLAFAFIDVCWCYGRTYYAVTEAKSWSNAEAYCVSEYGGHLATITDKHDMADSTTVRTNAGLYGNTIWLGLYDAAGDNTGWTWVDGTTCEYVASGDCTHDTYWNPGEPNYVSEACGFAYKNYQTFTDARCSLEYSFLCSTGGTTYYGVNTALSWTNAEAYCVANGGHLATITDSDEMLAVTRARANAGIHGYDAWIGLRETGDNTGWGWVDGTSCDYVDTTGDCTDDDYWYPGQPSDDSDDDCGEIFRVSKVYNDQPCSMTNRFICQGLYSPPTPSPTTTEPTTAEPTTATDELTTTYYGVNTDLSWINAEAYCVANGGHLATITNSDEMAAVTQARINAGIYSNDAWIGLHETGDNTDWVWVDGTNCDYVETTADCTDDDYWYPNQPSDDSDDDCGEFLANTELYNDQPCAWTNKFICQYSNTNRPTYYGVNTGLSWANAEDYCVTNGGHLATITNSDEMAAVTEARTNAGIYNKDTWIGLHETGDNTGWVWVDGTSCDYVRMTRDCTDDDYWYPNQPSDDSDDDCGEFLANTQLYNDQPCSWTNSFVCQYCNENPRTSPATPVPTYLPDIPARRTTSTITAIQYYAVKQSKNWDDAEAYCVSQCGSHLATITNEADSLAAESARQNAGIYDSPVWIGMWNMAHGDGVYVWVDGTNCDYVSSEKCVDDPRWNANEPSRTDDNEPAKIDHYCNSAHLNIQSSLYNAAWCTDKYYFMCSGTCPDATTSSPTPADRLMPSDPTADPFYEPTIDPFVEITSRPTTNPTTKPSTTTTLSTTSSTSSTTDAPGTRMYYAVKQRKSWSDAQAYCVERYKSYNGHLATITDSTDSLAAYSARKSAGIYKFPVWIGMYDETQDNNGWAWVDGTSCDYACSGDCTKDLRWNRYEPRGVDQFCGHIKKRGSKFNSAECENTYYFMCSTGGPPSSGRNDFMNVINPNVVSVPTSTNPMSWMTVIIGALSLCIIGNLALMCVHYKRNASKYGYSNVKIEDSDATDLN